MLQLEVDFFCYDCDVQRMITYMVGSLSINTVVPKSSSWDNLIPSKISLFLWRVLWGRLPNDDKVSRLGFHSPWDAGTNIGKATS